MTKPFVCQGATCPGCSACDPLRPTPAPVVVQPCNGCDRESARLFAVRTASGTSLRYAANVNDARLAHEDDEELRDDPNEVILEISEMANGREAPRCACPDCASGRIPATCAHEYTERDGTACWNCGANTSVQCNAQRIPGTDFGFCTLLPGHAGAHDSDGCESWKQPCNACDTVDYAGELDDAGRCAACVRESAECEVLDDAIGILPD